MVNLKVIRCDKYKRFNTLTVWKQLSVMAISFERHLLTVQAHYRICNRQSCHKSSIEDFQANELSKWPLINHWAYSLNTIAHKYHMSSCTKGATILRKYECTLTGICLLCDQCAPCIDSKRTAERSQLVEPLLPIAAKSGNRTKNQLTKEIPSERLVTLFIREDTKFFPQFFPNQCRSW